MENSTHIHFEVEHVYCIIDLFQSVTLETGRSRQKVNKRVSVRMAGINLMPSTPHYAAPHLALPSHLNKKIKAPRYVYKMWQVIGCTETRN